MSELIGQVLGHYRIVEQIGVGGMGVVYRARDERLGRDVAIKVLPESVVQDRERLSRFEREARAVARLAHPNILEIHELGELEDRPYMVTEVLDGETLRERLQGGQLGWRKAAEIGAAIADGLGAAHQASVVHRDLKPSNVFLTSDGRVKVLDFGLARLDEEVDQEAETVTHSPAETEAGAVMGTPGYMAPEQVIGKPSDPRSDIFSLGCVLYEMVTGTRAFKGDTAVGSMNAILKEEPPEISTSDEALPPELIGAVSRCLEKRPESRFQSANDLAYILRTISGTRVPMVSDVAHPTGGRKRPALWIGFVATVVIAAAVGLSVWAPWQTALEQTAPQPETPAKTEVAPRPPQNRVVVLPFINRTGDPVNDAMGHALAARIWGTLAEDSDVDVVPMAVVDETLVSTSVVDSGIAAAVNAGMEVSGSISSEGKGYRIQAVVQDLISGHLRPFEVVCPQEDTSECTGQLAARVAEVVEMQNGEPELLLMLNRLPSYEAFCVLTKDDDEEAAVAIDPAIGIFRRLIAANGKNVQGEDDEAKAILQDVLDTHRASLSQYGGCMFRGGHALYGRKYAQSMGYFRQALDLEPSSLWVRAYVARAALNLNRPLEAAAVFADINPCDNYSVWVPQALHNAGDFDRELDTVRAALACWPAWERMAQREVLALAALGRIDEMEKVIERILTRPRGADYESLKAPVWMLYQASLELRFRGDHEAERSLAERALNRYSRALDAWRSAENAEPSVEQELTMADLSWQAGHESEAWELCQTLAERAPDRLEVVWYKGILAARRGDRQRAEEADAVLASAGETRGGINGVTYNRACISAQLGDTDRALDLLRDAIALGASEWDYIRLDPDLEPLRDNPTFQELVRPKG